MTPEEIKRINEDVEKTKKRAIEAIESIKLSDKNEITQTFVLFPFANGQPLQPITLGVDKDLFGMVSDDFIRHVEAFEKESKIMQIQDPELRARLLNNLRSGKK